MKAGRAIGVEEHDARLLAQRLVDDARAEAERLQSEANQLRRDAKELAAQILADARAEAERIRDAPRTTSGPELGTVDEIAGTIVHATIGAGRLGDTVMIDRQGGPVAAEIVGFRGAQAILVPLGELAGIGAGSAVRRGEPLAVPCGDDVLGRVLDGLGAPLDGGPALRGEPWAIDRAPPPALGRPPISAPQPTGIRAIDALVTLGRGQRVALVGPRGAGTTTLLGQIARGAAVDVVVQCTLGQLGELGDTSRTVVVHAPYDAPPLVRARAASTATAIAEWFRERRGASVLLLVDSFVRVANAQRDAAIAAGEPVLRDGYPASALTLIARLVARAGATTGGAITAIYAGNGGIADELRAMTEGEIALDRELARSARFPAIDVTASSSRVMSRVVDGDHATRAAAVRARLTGNSPQFEAFIRQRDPVSWDDVVAQLVAL
jgi:type III secretion protein N (ATPase)